MAKYRRTRTLTPPPDEPTTVGARLRRARARKGLTLQQLAAPFFTRSYLSAVELGRIRPSFRALRHLADKLGVPVEELTAEDTSAATTAATRAPLRRSPRLAAVADRQIEVYEALRARDETLARCYASALQILRGDNPDPFAAAAHEIRELIERWNAPVPEERRGLAQRFDDLRVVYEEARRSSLATLPDGWKGEIDGPLREYLLRSEALFAWRAQGHVPTRIAVIEMLRAAQPRGVPEASVKMGAAAWIQLRDFFVNVAHHRRTTDRDEFEGALEALEMLVLRIERPAKHTFTTMATLDDAIAAADRSGVTPELIRDVVLLLARRDIQAEHFFAKATAVWVGPLRREGFFKTPPAAERTERELMFPFWPEGGYLARVASVAPDVVTDTFMKMDETDNVHVHHDLIEAAMAMPREHAAKLAKREAAWIKTQPHVFFLLPHEASKLVAKLAAEGEVKAALGLADALLDVLPAEEPAPGKLASAFGPRPRTRSDDWEFGEALKVICEPLTDAAGLGALDLFIAKLKTYLDLWRGPDEEFDYSDIWFDAIEGGGPERDAHELLAAAVRDSARQIVRMDATRLRAVVERLERARWPIFHRIALHLLRTDGGGDPQLVTGWVTSPRVQRLRSASREYRQLVREHFDAVPQKERENVIAAVVQLAEERLRRDLGDARLEPAVIQRERRVALAFALAPFAQWLEREWKARWDAVANELTTAHEERPRRGAVWSGPTSPYTSDALVAMDDQAVVELLRTWVPTDPIAGPSREGLSRVLEAAVAQTPSRFVALAPAFAELDPAYVRAVFGGLTAALRNGEVFPWGPVLQLAEAMYALPLAIPGRAEDAADLDEDSHPGWLRGNIARMLEAGLGARPGSLALEERARIGRLLALAVDDESPIGLVMPEGKRDWPTVAVNSPRGRAGFLLVEFAAWLSRSLRQSGETGALHLNSLPEFGTAMEHLLHRAAPETHAALGMDFARLVAIDTAWARANVERIFPRDRTFLRSVAWEAYVLFSRPYDNVLPILHDLYVAAVDSVDAEPVTQSGPDPREHLSEHVLLFYLRGLIPLDGAPSLVAFYVNARPDLRKHAMQFLGRVLDDEGPVVAAPAMERLRALIDWRIDVARRDPALAEEIAAFGWLFKVPTLDPTWSLRTATEAVRVAGHLDPIRYVIERAGALSEEHSKDVLDLLEAVAASSTMLGHVEPQSLERAITPALRNPALRERGVDVANALGQRGFVSLRALVSGAEIDDAARWLKASYRRRVGTPGAKRT